LISLNASGFLQVNKYCFKTNNNSRFTSYSKKEQFSKNIPLVSSHTFQSYTEHLFNIFQFPIYFVYYFFFFSDCWLFSSTHTIHSLTCTIFTWCFFFLLHNIHLFFTVLRLSSYGFMNLLRIKFKHCWFWN
jgi:hypothetical protein